jgi:ABC-2 type transport system permease protein
MSATAVQLKYDVLRTLRNRRMLAFAIGLPLVLFYAVAGSQRHARTDGIAFPLYFMTGMAVYGALFAVTSPAGRIAIDRARGWTRQLRITPLSVRTYYVCKVVTAYLIALPTIALLFIAGATLGVHLSAGQWLEMTGLLIVGLVPFVIMGVIIGHLVEVDALAPAVGGTVVLFSLFGGVYGQFFHSGVMLSIVKLLPSFWLVQAGKASLLHRAWPIEGWLVIAVWTAALVPLAMLVYRRDTARV